jgi:light-regulated signal transduction histidine kinase (bacteriophytochrome)
MFEPRTYTSATKLLLCISRSIINCHQGRIWVETNPGVGATFHFSLPLAPGEKTLERT